MKRPAFTLIELVVVLLIVACLLCLVVPAVLRIRRSQAATQTGSFLCQLTLALQAADALHGKLPPATGFYGQGEKVKATLHIHLLPFIEQRPAYEHIRSGQADAKSLAVIPFVSPSDPSMHGPNGITTFGANLRVFSDLGLKTPIGEPISPDAKGSNPGTGEPWFFGNASLAQSIPDGTSNTIAFATQYSVCGMAQGRNFFANSAEKKMNSPFFGYFAPSLRASSDDGIENGREDEIFQLAPAIHSCNPTYTAHGYTRVGIAVSVLGGSARVVSSDVSPEIWRRLLQPNDGKPLPADW